MTLDLSQHGRARTNLPHGFVGLDVTADRLTLNWPRYRSRSQKSIPSDAVETQAAEVTGD